MKSHTSPIKKEWKTDHLVHFWDEGQINPSEWSSNGKFFRGNKPDAESLLLQEILFDRKGSHKTNLTFSYFFDVCRLNIYVTFWFF